MSFAAYGVIASPAGAVPADVVLFHHGGGVVCFPWYNGHPAQMFMGDTGSLAMGARWRWWL